MARKKNSEGGFQDRLKEKLENMFPGCMIFKMNQIQGIPDFLVLVGNTWFSLENKKSEKAAHQPNQDYYVDKMNKMSFSRIIYPENEEEVLNEIQSTFQSNR